MTPAATAMSPISAGATAGTPASGQTPSLPETTVGYAQVIFSS